MIAQTGHALGTGDITDYVEKEFVIDNQLKNCGIISNFGPPKFKLRVTLFISNCGFFFGSYPTINLSLS